MSRETIDLIVVICYFAGITAIGIIIGRRQAKSKTGFFLGGRQFGFVLVGCSLLATNINSNVFVAEMGTAYTTGFTVANPHLLGGFWLAISAIFFMPMFLRSGIFTLPAFLELRFNQTAKLIYGFTFIMKILLGGPLGIYAGAIVATGLFNIDVQHLWIVCLIIGVCVGAYAVLGGLMAVVITDFIQTIILMGGGILLSFIALMKAGDIEFLQTNWDTSHFKLLLPLSHEKWPWTAVVFGMALHSLFFATSNASMMQRALGARSVEHAQGGMILAGFLKVIMVFIIVMPGIVASHLFPDIEPHTAFQVLVMNYLPAGVSGLLLVALISSLMSSEDSGVMTVASIVALDIYPIVDKNVTEKRGLVVGRITAGAVLAFGAIVAPFIHTLDTSLFRLIMKTTSFLIASVGICYVIGRFSRRVNSYGAVTTLASGFLIGTTYIISTSIPALRQHLPDTIANAHFYHVLPIFCSFHAILLFVVSWLTPPPSEKQLAVLDLAKKKDETESGEKRPFYKTVKFWFWVYLGTLASFYLVLA